MDNEFENLQDLWKRDKKNIEQEPKDLNKAISVIMDKKKSSTDFHYGNIIVLLMVVIGLVAFFYFVAPVQELLSRVGVGLMIGGLLVRIIIEAISVGKAKKINMIDNALRTTEDTIDFYNYRRKIHGPITITIMVLYSVGFYMISPEFSKYFDTWKMILIDGSYIFIAAALILVIRKGIKKEMKTLSEIIEIKKGITEEKS